MSQNTFSLVFFDIRILIIIIPQCILIIFRYTYFQCFLLIFKTSHYSRKCFLFPNFSQKLFFWIQFVIRKKKKRVGRCVFADIIVIHIEKSKKNSKIGITDITTMHEIETRKCFLFPKFSQKLYFWIQSVVRKKKRSGQVCICWYHCDPYWKK